jgi:hypothetical protein
VTRAAVAVVVVFVAFVSGMFTLQHANGTLSADADVGVVLAFAAFTGVGAVVLAKRPGNAVGWIFSTIGLLVALGAFSQEYTQYAYRTEPGGVPGGIVAAWIGEWWWYPLLGLVAAFTPLLFPTGRPPSRRWTPVMWLAGAAVAAITVLAALNPELEVHTGLGESPADVTKVPNPIGVEGVGDIDESLAGSILFAVWIGLAFAAVASVVVRFRRSRGIERQQLKWFTFAAVLLLLLPLSDLLPSDLDRVENVAFGVVVGFVPVAAGIAILRYRLYDIDVVINRTLVYGSLTALLAATYLGLVLLLQLLFQPLTQDSDLAIAGSTLAVAALFRPARRRIQEAVDRRFYRRKYDATRTLEAFSARLREEVDLEALSADVRAVVRETVQPAHVSLWLREARA